MSAHTSIGPARRRTFSTYVLLYVVAAVLAAGYLALLSLRPDLVATRQDPAEMQAKLEATQRHVADAIGTIDPLKQTVGEVKTDLDKVKADIDEAALRDQVLMEKVETLERTAAETQQKMAAALTPPPAASKAAAAKAAAKPAAKAAEPAHKPIETGSISEKAWTAAPTQAPPAVGVLLATGPSVDSLRLSWNILNDRHADAVSSLQARYVISGKPEARTYGLVAGPLQTIADAKSVCKKMMDRGEACEVSQFRGNAF